LKLSIPSSDFPEIFNNSTLICCSQISFRVYNKKNPQGPRVSFAINKKLGPAYKRNWFKRQARSLFCAHFVKNNDKIALIIIPKSINLKRSSLVNSFDLLTKKLCNV